MNELILPVKSSVIGTVVKMETLSAVDYARINRDATVVTIEDLLGAVHEIWFGDAMIAEFGLNAVLFEGNAVSVEVEERIANVTQFESADGTVGTHEFDSIAAVNAAHASIISLAKNGVPEFAIRMIMDARAAKALEAKPRERKFHADKSVSDSDLADRILALQTKADSAPEGIKKQILAQIAILSARLPKEPKATAK